MADSKISALTDGVAVQAADEFVVARSGSDLRIAGSQVTQLVKVYDYTVTGADKASIDTDVDGAMAGLFRTDGAVLEVLLQSRTDEAVVRSLIKARLNNDSGANYDIHDVYAINATVATDGPTLAGTQWGINVNGASCAANFFSSHRLTIPAYADTTAYKRGSLEVALGDSTAANIVSGMFTVGYRSTSAITRLSITPNTAGKNLKIGTRLLVYVRL